MRNSSYQVFENFLEEVFQYRGAGAVILDGNPPNPGYVDGAFTVTAEVYTDSPNGRYTTQVQVREKVRDSLNLGTQATYGSGERAFNAGVTSNNRQRVNVGVFNRESKPEIYDAYIYSQDGTLIETIAFFTGALGWAQKPVKAQFENGYIEWEGRCSSCRAYPWVVTVDNQSNDGLLQIPQLLRW